MPVVLHVDGVLVVHDGLVRLVGEQVRQVLVDDVEKVVLLCDVVAVRVGVDLRAVDALTQVHGEARLPHEVDSTRFELRRGAALGLRSGTALGEAVHAPGLDVLGLGPRVQRVVVVGEDGQLFNTVLSHELVLDVREGD